MSAELSARRTAASAVLADFRRELASAPLSRPPEMAVWALRLADVLGSVLEAEPDDAGALAAVHEALDIPHAATVGDGEKRDAILMARVMHAVVMLRAIDGPADVAWHVAYLRERLAEHPATGYKTWDEAVAELKAAKDGAR